MSAAHAFVDTYVDVHVRALRNTHSTSQDYPIDDDYAIFLCEASAAEAHHATWSWQAAAGCVKFYLWDSPTTRSYYLHKQICTGGRCGDEVDSNDIDCTPR